jgi:hypothetical protein
MPEPHHYQLLANGVLVLHLGVVLFVIGGLLLVVVGNLCHWRWVNRLWFRIAHLAAIAIVVAESWFGIMCPLTSLESWLRSKTGAAPASQGFIEHWVEFLLYYDAPTWVFTLAYTTFGLLVAAAWWYFPPERRQRKT